ncbi:MAG: hypothetical protein J1F11_09990 [Oscillospiraceae bacterium]|nr:hypothetical protein [Oscillospiraceae bacterium]
MSKIEYQNDGSQLIYDRMKKGKKRFLLADEVGLGKTVTAASVIVKMLKDHEEINVGYICGSAALAKENVRKLENEIKRSANGPVEFDEKRSYRLSLAFLPLLDAPSAANNTKRVRVHTLTPSTTINFTSSGQAEELAYAYFLLTGDVNGTDELLFRKVYKWDRHSVKDFTSKQKKAKENLAAAAYDLNNKDQNLFNSFKKDFEASFDSEWNKKKEKLYDQFYEYFDPRFYSVHHSNLSREQFAGCLEAIAHGYPNTWSAKILSDICSYMNVGTPDLSAANDDNKNKITDYFSDELCSEALRIARQCMTLLSVSRLKFDLILADEIQNYSDIFRNTKSDTEMEIVSEKLIHGDHKIVLMSATPFRFHTKLSERENIYRDNDADSYTNVSRQNNNIDNAQRYIEQKTDIYYEFKKIISYLIYDDMDPDKWFEEWEEINRRKFSVIGRAQHYKGDVPLYKKYIGRQSEMLRAAGVSRVERYMSGNQISINDKENKVIEWNDILRRELRRMPVKVFEDDREDRDDVLLRKDFIKSTPAFFSFKQGEYKTLDGILDEKYTHTLSKERIVNYQKLFADGKNDEADNGLLYNARIAGLFRVLFDKEELHKLLFIPPSRGDVKLSGVFEGKRGISKRLFFSDYNMTTRSLSMLLSYEAERRTVEDIKKRYGIGSRRFSEAYYEESRRAHGQPSSQSREMSESGYELVRRMRDVSIPITPESSNHISICDLLTFGYKLKANIFFDLYEYDKEQYDNGKRIDGSPCRYAMEHKNIFCTENDAAYYSKADDKKFYDGKKYGIENFCVSYFRYMTKHDSLLVLAAYSKGYSLYEMIMNYGTDGCIDSVLDEYFEYIPILKNKKNNDKPAAESFHEIIGNNPYYHIKTGVKNDKPVEMPVSFAIGHYDGENKTGDEGNKALTDTAKANTLSRKIQKFNSPFRPLQFITTSIGQEGFDFHVYCRKVVHWSLEFNPVKFEQREGRINRYQSYANRLNLYDRYFLRRPSLKEKKFKLLKKKFRLQGSKNKRLRSFINWKKAFESVAVLQSDMKKSSKGLFPDFVVPMSEKYGLTRECYYYPGSFEAHELENVLRAVGYYRALLGQESSESFEEDFEKFTAGQNTREFFVDLYPEK